MADPAVGESAEVTYAFATCDTTTAGARTGPHASPQREDTPLPYHRSTTFRHEVAAAFRMWEAAANRLP